MVKKPKRPKDPNSSPEQSPFLIERETWGKFALITPFLSDQVLHPHHSLLPTTAPFLPHPLGSCHSLQAGRKDRGEGDAAAILGPRLQLACCPTGDPQLFWQERRLCILIFPNTIRTGSSSFRQFKTIRKFYHVFTCTKLKLIFPCSEQKTSQHTAMTTSSADQPFLYFALACIKITFSFTSLPLVCLFGSSLCLPHSQCRIVFHTTHCTCKSFPLPCKAIFFSSFNLETLTGILHLYFFPHGSCVSVWNIWSPQGWFQRPNSLVLPHLL